MVTMKQKIIIHFFKSKKSKHATRENHLTKKETVKEEKGNNGPTK